MQESAALTATKIIHTIAWAFFASCILAIPIAAWHGAFRIACWLIAVVSVEVLVLAVNGMVCPLTKVARRYTDARHDNFDIYLPLWLARYNKHIFGTLFAASLAFTLMRWMGWP